MKDSKNEFVPDPEMVNILSQTIETYQSGVLRAKEYLRAEEIKLEKAKKRLEQYKKGKLRHDV